MVSGSRARTYSREVQGHGWYDDPMNGAHART